MRKLLIVAALAAGLVFAAGAQSQHGPTTGHLLGSGAFGNIQFLSKEVVTTTPELVADLAVSPDGQWAFLANWGSPTAPARKRAGRTHRTAAPGSSTSAT